MTFKVIQGHRKPRSSIENTSVPIIVYSGTKVETLALSRTVSEILALAYEGAIRDVQ